MAKLLPADVRVVWDSIRPGLEVVRLRTGAEWRVEDIYAACVAGKAFLYLSETGAAFCVLELSQNEFTRGSECFVWAAYVSDENYSDYILQVAAIAREAGADRLVMASTRKGWDRRPEWKPVYTTYAMEL